METAASTIGYLPLGAALLATFSDASRSMMGRVAGRRGGKPYGVGRVHHPRSFCYSSRFNFSGRRVLTWTRSVPRSRRPAAIRASSGSEPMSYRGAGSSPVVPYSDRSCWPCCRRAPRGQLCRRSPQWRLISGSPYVFACKLGTRLPALRENHLLGPQLAGSAVSSLAHPYILARAGT